ncbi:MAG: hypothetical protein HYY25_11855 [Candidatus Wallbacteria bacterium]|nr:hypothetical protein [Candidatus Wallbacteria bacterium]
MARRIELWEAQAHLKELIETLAPGEELVITDDQQPVAKLVGQRPETWQRPGPGFAKGMITIVADDEDHLKDFADYLP